MLHFWTTFNSLLIRLFFALHPSWKNTHKSVISSIAKNKKYSKNIKYSLTLYHNCFLLKWWWKGFLLAATTMLWTLIILLRHQQYLNFCADCGLGFLKKSSLKGFCCQNKRLRTPDVSPVVWSQSSALCFFHLIALLHFVRQTITMLSQLLEIMATKTSLF